ncbi:hypothetical protein DGG96_14495 [Legionella qingyii]|uniref:Uncharacterized protein n=1 Tax=Legionella qingyii TaxID=2184757 RepID=A0A317U130_9GAMM|nr:hypothetical protein DGG96_14495 [Legionella qingyii]
MGKEKLFHEKGFLVVSTILVFMKQVKVQRGELNDGSALYLKDTENDHYYGGSRGVDTTSIYVFLGIY